MSTGSSVLLYSDDITTRDAVRAAAGRRPARDVEVVAWRECATAEAVIEAMDAGGYDVVVLDGEATPVGGLGLADGFAAGLGHNSQKCRSSVHRR